MKVSYINHSSFSIELSETVLIFDYFKGQIPQFPTNKHIYVFASHAHYDHFNRSIYELSNQYDKIDYILSDDIPVRDSDLKNCIIKEKKGHIHSIGAGEKRLIGNLAIETLKSTDEGVAFLIAVEGKQIYHAGDLNWWHWNGEPEDWNVQMGKDFKIQIDLIRERHFDLAFLPLDSRLEDNYALGFDYFMKHTSTDKVIPMHCWDEFSVVEKIRQEPFAVIYANRILAGDFTSIL